MKGDGKDTCPVCSQPGTVAVDDDGYVLVDHPGRAFPCRPRPATPGEWVRVQSAVLVASARGEPAPHAACGTTVAGGELSATHCGLRHRGHTCNRIVHNQGSMHYCSCFYSWPIETPEAVVCGGIDP